MNEEERKALIEGLRAEVEKHSGKVMDAVKQVETDLSERLKVQEGTKDAIAELNTKGQELFGRVAEMEQKLTQLATARPGTNGSSQKSAGQQFVESDELKEFVAKGGRGQSRQKMISSLPASAGPAIWSDRLDGIVVEPNRPFSIRQLLAQGTTESNLIEWVKENVFTNMADVVSEGAQKPESNITFERVDVPVRTIAHWIMATRQVLADFKQLATHINTRLSYGLKLAEENQLLLGDGTGENLLGLIPQATAYNTSLNRANDTFIDVIRHAMLQVRLSFYPSTGIVLTPNDWHNIELTKDNENRYLMANPAGRLPAMLWGLPVAESDALPVDQFLVGSFALAATVFDREQMSIMVSTEDRDNFVKNLVTILCEERLALAVSRPKAFVHGSFPAGSTT